MASVVRSAHYAKPQRTVSFFQNYFLNIQILHPVSVLVVNCGLFG